MKDEVWYAENVEWLLWRQVLATNKGKVQQKWLMLLLKLLAFIYL